MSQELFFTSAPRGLQAGSSGFCTVAVTSGLPPALRERLEALSAYRHLLPPLDPNNPVAYSHLRLSVGGRTYSVLSRIGPAGLDYSQRSNKFAHHVVLEPGELPPGGPAWLLLQSGFMEPAWDGQVRQLPAGRKPPMGDGEPWPCMAWEELTGDAGWAGVLAEAFERDPNQTVYLMFRPGEELLALLAEAVALLPAEKRWQVTFSTYHTGLPPGTACAWRCVAQGSVEAKEAARLPSAFVLDMTAPLGQAQGGPLVEQARNGRPTLPPASRQEVEWPAGAPQIPSRRPDRIAAPQPGRTPNAFGGSLPLPPPPPAPAITKPPSRWRTRWLWLTIGVLIGFLATSGVTAVLAHFGAVHLGLLQNQDDLQTVITDLREERGRLESERDRLQANVRTVSRELKELERDREDRSNKVEELKQQNREAETRQKELRAKNQIAASELKQLEKEVAAKKESLDQLPLFKELVQLLKSKAGKDSLLSVAIDEYLSKRAVKKMATVSDGFDKWYASRVEFDFEPYKLWKRIDQRLKGTESSGATEETRLDLSEKIVEDCHEIMTRHKTTLAARLILEARESVWKACERVTDQKEPAEKPKADRLKALKSKAQAVQNWLDANHKRKQ